MGSFDRMSAEARPCAGLSGKGVTAEMVPGSLPRERQDRLFLAWRTACTVAIGMRCLLRGVGDRRASNFQILHLHAVGRQGIQ